MAGPIRHRSKRTASALPGWMMTFADLMTLLLTFFILLLSFSKMDAEKYKAIALSMAKAFGGATVIQSTGTGSGATLSPLVSSAPASVPATSRPPKSPPSEPEIIPENAPRNTPANIVPKGVETLATRLVDQLAPQIATNHIKVQYNSRKVTIRFSEDATFPSGSARLKAGMKPIIDRIVEVLARCPGQIEVDGYTDNRPIVSSRYRSNWDLSAARAVSVVHELVLNRKINAEDVTAAGHAETHPLAPNTTAANRALNRRVEINVHHPHCREPVKVGPAGNN